MQAVEPSLDAGPETKPNEWQRANPAALPELWREYRPLILRLLDRGDGCFDERDIMTMLLLERWSLWVAPGDELTIAIAEVLEFPRKRVLLVRYAAGDKDTIVAGEAWLEGLARNLNCQTIEIYGRIGWELVVPSWTRARTILRRDVL